VGPFTYGRQRGPVCRITPGGLVRLADEAGSSVPRGEVGELLIRGPQVTVGYWATPHRIEPAIRDGWYHIRDLIRQGEGDDFWFAGHKKDLIIRGGSIISPVEVERVLLNHPFVSDAAVFGLADPVLGQRVAAMVKLVAPADHNALNDIRVGLRAELADYKCPECLVPVDAIPRNPLGKVDRKALAATMAEKDLLVTV
jgi:long-chain acyl-CoA synthetase